MTSWDVHHPPRADGRTVLVTGGNAGIGYFVAEQLAGAGATVLLGCRDAARAEAAMTAIRSVHPAASLRFLPLDLADRPSLPSSVARLTAPLDAVVLNAGVMIEGPDPDERTFAINHLGHFALTALLAPCLSPTSRVVTTGSFVAKSAFRSPRPRARRQARLRAFQARPDALRLRAGAAGRRGQRRQPSRRRPRRPHAFPPARAHPSRRAAPSATSLAGQGRGAWPAVRCVLDPEVHGGQLWGPRMFGLRGVPRLEPVRGILADEELAKSVWERSIELTGLDPSAAMRSAGRPSPHGLK